MTLVLKSFGDAICLQQSFTRTAGSASIICTAAQLVFRDTSATQLLWKGMAFKCLCRQLSKRMWLCSMSLTALYATPSNNGNTSHYITVSLSLVFYCISKVQKITNKTTPRKEWTSDRSIFSLWLTTTLICLGMSMPQTSWKASKTWSKYHVITAIQNARQVTRGLMSGHLVRDVTLATQTTRMRFLFFCPVTAIESGSAFSREWQLAFTSPRSAEHMLTIPHSSEQIFQCMAENSREWT